MNIKIDITVTGGTYAMHDGMSIEAAKTFLFGFKAGQNNQKTDTNVTLDIDIYRIEASETGTQKWQWLGNLTSVYPEILLDALDALEAKYGEAKYCSQ